MNEVRRTKADDEGRAQLSVPSALLTQAQALGVDPVRAAADGIRRAVMDAQAARYAEENRDAVAVWNEYVTENGLPFEDIMEQPI